MARGDRSLHPHRPVNRGVHGYAGVATDAAADPARVLPDRPVSVPPAAVTPLRTPQGEVVDSGEGGGSSEVLTGTQTQARTIYVGDEDPSVEYAVDLIAGDQWIDTSSGLPFVQKTWDATAEVWLHTTTLIQSVGGDALASSVSSTGTSGANRSATVTDAATATGTANAEAQAQATAVTVGSASVDRQALVADGDATAKSIAYAAGSGTANASSAATSISSQATIDDLAETTSGQAVAKTRALTGAGGTAEATLGADSEGASAAVVVYAQETTGRITFMGALLVSLPTADPVIAGQLWADAGIVKVSAG